MNPLTYAPDLVEEAVLLAERVLPAGESRAFRRERDRIYESPDQDGREAAFQSLHRRWFLRLGFQRVVDEVVGEFPEIAVRVGEGRVVRALTRSEEGADLIDRISGAGTQPVLVLRLRPAILLEPEALRVLLRHELMHVADMLDPVFAYERALPASEDGPSADNILRDRYRVLWDVTIDGRLARAGLADAGAREARWREFAATYLMLGERGQDTFDVWFDRIRPTHRSLVAFALAPNGPDRFTSADSGHCPLCRFPVASLDLRPERLSPAAVAIIRADYPGWRIEQGLCSQCLDLYEARQEETAGANFR